MEIYEKGAQITIPSFIFYVSPFKNALFKPFVISAYCTEYHAGTIFVLIMRFDIL